MPYLVSSIIAVVTALIILLTRYEADDSAITAEIERAKSMFITVDGFVNTYIQSGGDMTRINFEQLFDDGILLGNMTKDIPTSTANVKVVAGAIADKSFAATLEFQNSKIKWQIVPIVDYKINDYRGVEIDLAKSVGSGYQLFIDFTNDNTLMSKNPFSENFLGREFCEKVFFGSFINNAVSISTTTSTLNQIVTTDGTSIDGKLSCIIFK